MVIGTSFSLARNERASVKHLALVIESSNSPTLSAADSLPEPWSGPRDERRVLGTEAEILCQLAINTPIQYIQSKKQAEECVVMAQIGTGTGGPAIPYLDTSSATKVWGRSR